MKTKFSGCSSHLISQLHAKNKLWQEPIINHSKLWLWLWSCVICYTLFASSLSFLIDIQIPESTVYIHDLSKYFKQLNFEFLKFPISKSNITDIKNHEIQIRFTIYQVMLRKYQMLLGYITSFWGGCTTTRKMPGKK